MCYKFFRTNNNNYYWIHTNILEEYYCITPDNNNMPPLARDQTSPAGFFMDVEKRSGGGADESNNLKSCEGRVKCVLVGDGAVGKTSLVVSYTTNGYPTEYVPTAFDNYNVVVTVDSHPIRLQLCDTAGQHEFADIQRWFFHECNVKAFLKDDFDSLRPLCYPGTDVFLLCFSVVSPTSFYNVADKWIPEVRHHSPSTPIILVGTQCDLRSDVKVLIELANYHEQPVSENDARRLAQKTGIATYVECSALTQKNLKEVFDTAILLVLQRNEALKKMTFGKAKGKKLLLKASEKPCFRQGNCLNGDASFVNVHSTSPHLHKKKGWKKLCCFS